MNLMQEPVLRVAHVPTCANSVASIHRKMRVGGPGIPRVLLIMSHPSVTPRTGHRAHKHSKQQPEGNDFL